VPAEYVLASPVNRGPKVDDESAASVRDFRYGAETLAQIPLATHSAACFRGGLNLREFTLDRSANWVRQLDIQNNLLINFSQVIVTASTSAIIDASVPVILCLRLSNDRLVHRA
jgi:hypothetical protein